METIETLKARQSELLNRTKIVESLPELREIDTKLKHLKKVAGLDAINAKYARIRESAKQAYDTEKPEIDVTCNDGSFHKTKIKNYPKLAALQYTSVSKSKDNLILELRVNGERFDMYKAEYKNTETTYYNFENFEDFLTYNSIPVKEITLSEYDQMAESLNAANLELELAIAKYETTRKDLKIHRFQNWGLVGQSNTYLYKYSTKF